MWQLQNLYGTTIWKVSWVKICGSCFKLKGFPKLYFLSLLKVRYLSVLLKGWKGLGYWGAQGSGSLCFCLLFQSSRWWRPASHHTHHAYHYRIYEGCHRQLYFSCSLERPSVDFLLTEHSRETRKLLTNLISLSLNQQYATQGSHLSSPTLITLFL